LPSERFTSSSEQGGPVQGPHNGNGSGIPQCSERVLSRQGDILTILNDYITVKMGIFDGNLATLRLYFAETRGASFNIKAGLDKDIRKLYDKLVRQLALTLKKGIRENVLRKKDPYYMAVALEGITNAFLFTGLKIRIGIPTRRTSR